MLDPKQRQALYMVEFLLAKKSLHEFVRQAWPIVEPEIPFQDNWHIKAICDHLEAVASGKIPQLVINVPPGTSKSLITCVFFPAWVWATRPAKRFMTASYSETLSMRDAIRTRDLVTSAWYQRRWPLLLKADQNAKTRYDNAMGGWRIVGSVTGRGIGEHPDFFIADDPHNVLQAESDKERETTTRWFEGVFCVRGEVRDAKRILIMQRLHALDCTGVALDKGGWEHLCLPMRYEEPAPNEHNELVPRMKPTKIGFQDPRKKEGELLWPVLYTDDKVTKLENNMGLYNAAGQLQQRPSPRGGGKFQRNWFRILPVAPVLTRMVRYWDKSGSTDSSSAETAGVLLGEYRDEGAGREELKTKWCVLDVIHGRWQAAEREAIIKQTAMADQTRWGFVDVWVEQEPGSGGKESAQATVGNLVGFACYSERVTGAKEVRADPLASQASVGKITLLSARWNSQFLDEVEAFPNGKLKDFVDGASGAFNKLCTPSTGVASAAALRFSRRPDAFEEFAG